MTAEVRALIFLFFATFWTTLNKVQANNHQSRYGDVNISAILDGLQKGYDKRVRPNYGGKAVDVGITMYVLSISDLSEVQMDFTLDFYFRQFWQDPRLKFEGRPGIEMLSVGSEFIQKLWVPDTFFVNEKKSYFHTATTNNEFLRIMKSGNVVRSIRLTITAACPMDLQYFPMDRQLCNIEIESFGYTMRDIIYKWNEGDKSVGVSNEVSLPQFKVLGYRQKEKVISLTTGNYSRLACEIQFVRSMGYYLIQIYIPSSLIVIISWVSFWLNRNATPARVALGVTTVLTMTTLMSSTNAALPKISYVKSIDVYLGTCFVMVFASLLEYATVGYMGKRIQMRKNRILAMQKLVEQKKSDPTPIPDHGLPPPPPRIIDHPGRSHDHIPRGMDHHSRTLERALDRSLDRTFDRSLERGLDHGPRILERGIDHGGRTLDRSLERTLDHVGLCHASHIPVSSLDHEYHPKQAEVRFRVNDPKVHSKGGTLENTVNGGGRGEGRHDTDVESAPIALPPIKGDLNKLYGLTPSDIDKYSRVVFPVCFVCFNLMYWIIYLHISDVVADDLVLLNS